MAAVLTPEQAEALIKAMKAPKAPVVRTYRGRKIVQLLKSGECFTHSQIAAGLGITDESLLSRLAGYTFSDCELSEDDEIIAHWPKSGIVLVKSGKLKNMTRKKEAGPAEHGPLLRYAPGQAPLQRGIHGGTR
jgi:hypothetical protein